MKDTNLYEKRIQIFEDTQKVIEEELKDSIESIKLNQKYYNENYKWNVDFKPSGKTNIVISKKRTFEAAEPYVKSNKKTAVLNFASATSPGGGVTRGASAQEECLCRCSNLYNALTLKEAHENFYKPHLTNGSAIHNDDIIYTPDVCVIKTDVLFPKLMDKKDWYKVDVITCAAPNLREKPRNHFNMDSPDRVFVKNSELLKIHEKRARAILSCAVENGIKYLVLGAFGCGAFKNDPEVVAHAYKNVLKEFDGMFDTVEFAVYCSSYDTNNFDSFFRVFNS